MFHSAAANIDAERRRRHSVIQLAMMICFTLVMMDMSKNPNENASNRSSSNNLRGIDSRGKESIPRTAILAISESLERETFRRIIERNNGKHFNSTAGKIDTVKTKMKEFDISGVFKGIWESKLVSSPLASEGGDGNKNSKKHNYGKGKVVMQVKVVPVDKSLTGLQFVYGVMRFLPDNAILKSSNDLYLPVQGLFVVPTSRLLLFSTPLKEQALYLELYNTTENTRQSAGVHSINPLVITSSAFDLTVENVSSVSLVSDLSPNSYHQLPSNKQSRGLQLLSNGDLGGNYHDISDNSTAPQGGKVQGRNDSSILKISKSISENAENRSKIFKLSVDHVNSDISDGVIVFRDDIIQLTAKRITVSNRKASPNSNNDSRTSFPSFSLLAGFHFGTSVLPDVFHGLQDQATAFRSKSALGKCSSDTLIELQWAPNAPRPRRLQYVSNNLATTAIRSATAKGLVSSSACQMDLNFSASAEYIQFDLLEVKARNYAYFATTISFFQIGLLILQMKHASTQAASAKVSIIAICSQALLDAIICIGHLLVCAAVPNVFFFHFIWISVLKLLMFCIFEMKCIINIYQARYSQEGWAGLMQRLAAVRTRFYGTLFLVMVFLFLFHSWPTVIVLVLYSIWLPQIIYSAVVSAKKPFHTYFYVGMSITRMFIPLYVLGCPDNILYHLEENFVISPDACVVLVLWTAFQVTVLYLQDILGPRFFVPKYFLPVKYDYGRALSDDNSCANGDLSQECVICYSPVESDEYMVTPCDHLFHKPCLTQWIDIKLECPVCRAALPSIE